MRFFFLLVIVGYKLDVKLTALLLLCKGNVGFFCLMLFHRVIILSSERYEVQRR